MMAAALLAPDVERPLRFEGVRLDDDPQRVIAHPIEKLRDHRARRSSYWSGLRASLGYQRQPSANAVQAADLFSDEGLFEQFFAIAVSWMRWDRVPKALRIHMLVNVGGEHSSEKLRVEARPS